MNKKIYLVLFIAYILAYFLIYGRYGFNDADDGYTLALSWRIFNGQVPFRDFILVRPPFSPILHTLSLWIIPQNYVIVFERLLFYVFLALSSLFGALAIDAACQLKKYNINVYLLATIGFVFSASNFPPMPWHTLDGILLGSIGIYLLVKSTSSYTIAGGMLFLCLSALCKQPFYLLPILGIVYIQLMFNSLKKTAVAALSLVVYVAIIALIFAELGMLHSFLKYTSGSTRLRDLFNAGIVKYTAISSVYIILTILYYLIAKKELKGKPKLFNEGSTPYFFITLIFAFPVVHYVLGVLNYPSGFDTTLNNYYTDDVAVVLFIITFFYLVSRPYTEKQWLSLWFLMLVSWCTSISWGEQTPVLFSLPLVFGFLVTAYHLFKNINLNRLTLFLLLIGTVAYFIANQTPYLNPKRKYLTYDLSSTYPKLKLLKVDKVTFDRYQDLKKLVTKYGSNFKTLPGMPLSNFITGTKSPSQIDWVFNGETANRDEGIEQILAAHKTVVFVEKHPQLIGEENSSDRFNSLITYHIKNSWNRVDSTQYFYVYKR